MERSAKELHKLESKYFDAHNRRCIPIKEWKQEYKSTGKDEAWIRQRICYYTRLLQGVNDKEFTALCDDFSENITYFCKTVKKEETKQPSYGICEVCCLSLGKEWMHCHQCLNAYDECMVCWERKKKEGKPHPHHDMLAWNWGIFDKTQVGQNNILSFDGGGVRGYMSYLMFERYCKLVLERSQNVKDPSEEVLDQFVKDFVRKKFHLICGTSVGGIIAVCLALEINLSGIKSLFEKRTSDLFSKNWFWDVKASKYSDNGIRSIFHDFVKKYLPHITKQPEDLTFDDLKLPCAVSSFDIRNNTICWFSTQLFESKPIKLIDAVLSTSAAPTYFPIHSFVVDQRQLDCIDGGVWCNDPRLFAFFMESVINAFQNPEHKLDHIYNLISFGTGQAKMHHTNYQWGSSISWLVGNPNIIDVMFEGSTAKIEAVFPYMAQTGLVRAAKVQVSLDAAIHMDDASSLNKQREQFKQNISNPNSQINVEFENALRITWMMGIRGDEALPVIHVIDIGM